MMNKADSDILRKPVTKSAKSFSHTFLFCTYHAKVSQKNSSVELGLGERILVTKFIKIQSSQWSV